MVSQRKEVGWGKKVRADMGWELGEKLKREATTAYRADQIEEMLP